MKPILYEANTTSFTTHGLGVLGDAISCVVVEERNGQYELSMEYPIDGIHAEDITHSRIIYATPSDGAREQPFRIYKISKPINGIITVDAEHISYQLAFIPCGPFTASTVPQALQKIKTNALEDCPFDFWTDKTTAANYVQDIPASIRSRLGGTQGSILDTYGGEYEWDLFTVKLYNNRGENRGVTLRYGKNITDIKQEENISNTITGVVPFYKNEDELITLPEHAVYSSHASQYPFKRTIVVDFTSDFTEAPTVAQLRSRAENYINANGIGVPKVNLKVSFVALWQTEEYKNMAALERVKLCDTVNVFFEKLGIEAHAKVIKTTYDVLLERYNSIELGEATSKMSSKIKELETVTEEQLSTSDLENAINHATELITGGLGGYVVFNKNADGEPEEILIMDKPSTDTAVNVIRMNKNGIGFSNTGYSGTYRNAWTIDGKMVADFIQAGTLSGITVRGNSIVGNTIDGNTITGGTITGTSVNGGTVTGSVITNGNNFSVNASGDVMINNGNIIIPKIDPQAPDENTYIATSRNSAQLDMVHNNKEYTTEGGHTFSMADVSGHLKTNELSYVRNYVDGRGPHEGYMNSFGADGFNIAGGVVCDVEIEEEGPPRKYRTRLRTDRIYTASNDPQNASFTIFNNTSEEESSYALMFQSDGNLVIYNISTTPWTPVWSAWNP